MNNLNVLVTSCGGPSFPGVLKSLRHVDERAIRVAGCDLNGRAPGLYLADAGYPVPAIKDDAYVPALLDICDKENINVLLPASGSELVKICGSAGLFAAVGVRTVCPLSVDQYRTVLDKKACYDMLAADTPHIPAYRMPHTREELEHEVRSLGYPERDVLLKPVAGSGSRGIVIVRAMTGASCLFGEKAQYQTMPLETVLNIIEHDVLPPILAVEYLPGEEYSCDLLAEDGEIKYCIIRERLQVRSGVTSVGRVVDMKDVESVCGDIVASLRLKGNINVQVKRAVDGKLKLVEINPRISGTIVLGTAAGVNLVYFGIKMALGEPVPECPIGFGTEMVRYSTEIYLNSNGSFML